MAQGTFIYDNTTVQRFYLFSFINPHRCETDAVKTGRLPHEFIRSLSPMYTSEKLPTLPTVPHPLLKHPGFETETGSRIRVPFVSI